MAQEGREPMAEGETMDGWMDGVVNNTWRGVEGSVVIVEVAMVVASTKVAGCNKVGTMHAVNLLQQQQSDDGGRVIFSGMDGYSR